MQSAEQTASNTHMTSSIPHCCFPEEISQSEKAGDEKRAQD
jgi:hypothetical protein